MTQHVDDLLLTGGETADSAAECLAEGAGEDFDLTAQVITLGYAATGLAHHAGRVALVNHDHGIVFLSQFVNLV